MPGWGCRTCGKEIIGGTYCEKCCKHGIILLNNQCAQCGKYVK